MMIIKSNKPFIVTLLTLIFVVPMVTAWLAYSKGIFLTGRTTNHGELLTPPISLTTLTLSNTHGLVPMGQIRGKWWLLYVTNNPAEPLTKHNAYYMRQIRQATGKERDRVELAIISSISDPRSTTWIQQHYPNTHLFTMPAMQFSQLVTCQAKKLALSQASLYLVDPLGNIMMCYAPDAAPKGILKDLERVLKVSQIG